MYDFRDDPNDDCDFGGNRGCLGVSPPFDYVPSSDAEYRKRLAQIAEQIVRDLHGPDLILIQEAEDQDICTVDGGTLSCGSANDRDGKPDTLQELAVVIKSSSGPTYEAAFDRDGADDRGIVSAYLYRADRVELLPARQDDPVLGRDPRIAYRSPGLAYNDDVQNPKALNAGLPADVDRSTGTDGNDVFTRAPQVGLFRVWRDRIGASVFTDLYLLDNHFSSTPDRRVGQRREQAAYNAAIVAAVQAANPEARVVVGGDLNVYPRPDDPFGPPNTSDQLRALYERPMTNLWERLVAEVPAAAYSYVFQGQTQTLDQIFVTSSLLRELIQVRAAHINSDWPAEHDDGARGTSDHDLPVARFSGLPTIDRLQALVRFLETRGDITGQNTVRQLLDHLERAGRERGRSGEAPLRAFINQARGAAPQSLTQAAADILARETELLIESLDEQETRRQAADGASRQDENRDRARSSRTNTTQDSDEHRDRNLSPDRTRADDDRSGT